MEIRAAEQARLDAIQHSMNHDFSRTQLREIVRRAEVQVGLCGNIGAKQRYQDLGDAAKAIEDRYVELFGDSQDHLLNHTPAI